VTRRSRRLGLTVLALAGAFVVLAAGRGDGEEAREVPGPRLTFPTGLAVCPDGGLWVASTYADTLVRIDPTSGATRAIRLELASHPAALICDRRGALWFAASGRGYVGRLDPDSDKPRQFVPPRVATAGRAIPVPRGLAIHPGRQEVWFTIESDGLVGRVKLMAEPVRRGFVVTELDLGGPSVRPHGIAVDGNGAVWVAELGADRLTRIDPADDSLRRYELPPGSRPLEAASAPDGSVWVTLLGTGALLRVDPRTSGHRTWRLPAPAASPAAVAVDAGGAVWVSDLSGNRLLRFDAAVERFTSYALPHPRTAVRALTLDATGRLWFAGSGSGRLGRVD
jgi:virginiamycin B lyase